MCKSLLQRSNKSSLWCWGVKCCFRNSVHGVNEILLYFLTNFLSWRGRRRQRKRGYGKRKREAGGDMGIGRVEKRSIIRHRKSKIATGEETQEKERGTGGGDIGRGKEEHEETRR